MDKAPSSFSFEDMLVGERLLYIALFEEFDHIDQIWDRPTRMVSADNDARESVPGTVRIWWSVPHRIDRGGTAGFVSLEPPEFRTTRPSESDGVVLDLPESTGAPRPISSRLRAWCARQDSPAEEEGSARAELASRAHEALLLLQDNSDGEIQDAFWRRAFELSREGAEDLELSLQREFRLRMNVMSLAANLIMVGLMLRVDLPKDSSVSYARRNPVSSMKNAFPDASAEIVREAVRMGDFYYDHANELLRLALRALTLRAFYHYLFNATFTFWIARLVSENDDAVESGLSYTADLAEEGIAACFAGLAWKLVEYCDGTENLDGRFRDYYVNNDADGAEREVRGDSVPRNPLYPRHYLEVANARGMAMAGPRWAAKALEELPRLEAEYQQRIGQELSVEAMEGDYIEMAYLNAYKVLGQTEDVRERAMRLAARMIVRRHTGGH